MHMCVPMRRCQSVECFAHNSVNLQGDSVFFCCTRKCSCTGGGVLLQLDRLSAKTDTQTNRQTGQQDNKEACLSETDRQGPTLRRLLLFVPSLLSW